MLYVYKFESAGVLCLNNFDVWNNNSNKNEKCDSIAAAC